MVSNRYLSLVRLLLLAVCLSVILDVTFARTAVNKRDHEHEYYDHDYIDDSFGPDDYGHGDHKGKARYEVEKDRGWGKRSAPEPVDSNLREDAAGD